MCAATHTNPMTPEYYRQIRHDQNLVIADAQEVIDLARAQALESKPPKTKLRPATPGDILPDAIVWHETTDLRGAKAWRWHLVDEVIRLDSMFKAYIAEDGCRYGLNGAWVRK